MGSTEHQKIQHHGSVMGNGTYKTNRFLKWPLFYWILLVHAPLTIPCYVPYHYWLVAWIFLFSIKYLGWHPSRLTNFHMFQVG